MKQRSQGLDVNVCLEVNLAVEQKKSLALLQKLFEISQTISNRKNSSSSELSKNELFDFAMDFYNLYRFTKFSEVKTKTPEKSYNKVMRTRRTRVSRAKKELEGPGLAQMLSGLEELERSLNLHIKPTKGAFDKAWKSVVVFTDFLEFNSFDEEEDFFSSLEEIDLPTPTDNLPFILFTLKFREFFKGKSGVWEFLTTIRLWLKGRPISDLENFKVMFEESQISLQKLIASFTKENKNLVKKIGPFLRKKRG